MSLLNSLQDYTFVFKSFKTLGSPSLAGLHLRAVKCRNQAAPLQQVHLVCQRERCGRTCHSFFQRAIQDVIQMCFFSPSCGVGGPAMMSSRQIVHSEGLGPARNACRCLLEAFIKFQGSPGPEATLTSVGGMPWGTRPKGASEPSAIAGRDYQPKLLILCLRNLLELVC